MNNYIDKLDITRAGRLPCPNKAKPGTRDTVQFAPIVEVGNATNTFINLSKRINHF